MGQVTIYLDERTEKKARVAARSEGVSLSKWIAQRIDRTAQTEWPAFVRELAGAWPDMPDTARLRKSKRRDLPRRRL